jgi:hypothetical protein
MTTWKWFRRLSICIGVVVLAIGLLIIFSRIFGGRILQTSPNPKHTVTAEVIDSSGMATALDTGYLGVTLKTRFNPIRHYVFGGPNHGARVRVSWINDQVLTIQCDNCEKLEGGNIIEHQWHQVTICYDDPSMTGPPQVTDAACMNEPKRTVTQAQP